jgi:hypothetical protein
MKYVTEKSIIFRNQLLQALREPKNAYTLAEETGRLVYTVKNNIEHLEKLGAVKRCGHSKNISGQLCISYVAVTDKYHPVFDDEAFKIVPGGRIVSLTDKVYHTKVNPPRRNAWVGSTLGSMTF